VKVTLTFEDVPGGVKTDISLGEHEYDESSLAHKTAAMVIHFLDSMQVKTDQAQFEQVPPKSMLVTPVQRAIQVVRG